MSGRSAKSLDSSQTLANELAAVLKDEIQKGLLPPGTKLRQQDIARRFNVSTTPVREAFVSLERQGILIGSPHRGVIVFRPTLADLVQTYEIRIPLETLATERGVPNLTESDLQVMKKLLDEMDAVRVDDRRFIDLNDQFHQRIYAASQRPKLEALIGDLRGASASYLRLMGVTHELSAIETRQGHYAIYDACVARSPKRAGEAMAAHLQHTVDVVAPHLADTSELDT